MTSSYSLAFSLAGRIRNLTLPASAANALVPAFEAVTNSFQAIEARFGGALEQGKIHVSISHDNEGGEITIAITDNGIGMNEANFNSFRTSDSDHKLTIGGKGVGRLLWLKLFEYAHVESTYLLATGDVEEISFDFLLSGDAPITNVAKTRSGSIGDVGTVVKLVNMKQPYASYFAKRFGTACQHFVRHFLPYLASPKAPSIILHFDEDVADLRNVFRSARKTESSAEIALPRTALIDPVDQIVAELIGNDLTGSESLTIHHMLVDRIMSPGGGGTNWIYFVANKRVVHGYAIDNQIGLHALGPEKDTAYIGLVSGDFLDQRVSQERVSFAANSHEMDVVKSASVEKAKEYLSPYISMVREQQALTVAEIIKDNPQFLSVKDELEDFVATKLHLNLRKPEDIYVELSRHKLRQRNQRKRELERIKSETNKEEALRLIEQYSRDVNADAKGLLADYVVKRKSIIELLTDKVGFRDFDKEVHFKEEVIHDLICPLNSTSDDLGYDDHNLWLLDDRLAFYTYFASDRQFRTFVDSMDSRKEPDLAVFFDSSLAFQREQTSDPVVLVEFKRPGRDDYTRASHPLFQVIDYVREMRAKAGGVKNKDGRVVASINRNTKFVCYIVADLMPTLLDLLEGTPVMNPTQDGMGRFGHLPDINTYVEIISYEKLLRDANLRNEVFFKKLGLN